MILVIAVAGVASLVVAGLTWVARLLHISDLDALALAEKLSFPEPASALEWPELRVQSVVGIDALGVERRRHSGRGRAARCGG